MTDMTRRRAGTTIAVAFAALAATTPMAQAHDAAPLPGGICEGHVLTQPLTAFGDFSSYLLAPQADFESGLDSFATTGAPRIQNENESFNVSSPDDTQSAFLPAGSSVTTPPLCVTADYPFLRLFVRNESKDGKLGVQVSYTDAATGRTVVQGAGDIDAKGIKGTWTLSKSLPTFAGKLGTSLSIRLTAKDRSSWSVDDVLVDPSSRG